MKNIISKLAFISLFSFIICGSAMAVSYDSVHYASRFNTAGTTYNLMTTSYNHFCYLAQVSVEETDTYGEEANCSITPYGTYPYRYWYLEARLDKSSDADIECKAYCYNN